PSPEKSPVCDTETPIVIGAAGAVGALLPPQAAASKPSPATAAHIIRLCMLAPSPSSRLAVKEPHEPWIWTNDCPIVFTGEKNVNHGFDAVTTTLKELAARAKVHPSTISRIANHDPRLRVAPATRARIEALLRE